MLRQIGRVFTQPLEMPDISRGTLWRKPPITKAEIPFRQRTRARAIIVLAGVVHQ